MAIENGKITNGIAQMVNGKLIEVPLNQVGKITKPMNDKERLERYKGERAEMDRIKRGL